MKNRNKRDDAEMLDQEQKKQKMQQLQASVPKLDADTYRQMINDRIGAARQADAGVSLVPGSRTGGAYPTMQMTKPDGFNPGELAGIRAASEKTRMDNQAAVQNDWQYFLSRKRGTANPDMPTTGVRSVQSFMGNMERDAGNTALPYSRRAASAQLYNDAAMEMNRRHNAELEREYASQAVKRSLFMRRYDWMPDKVTLTQPGSVSDMRRSYVEGRKNDNRAIRSGYYDEYVESGAVGLTMASDEYLTEQMNRYQELSGTASGEDERFYNNYIKGSSQQEDVQAAIRGKAEGETDEQAVMRAMEDGTLSDQDIEQWSNWYSGSHDGAEPTVEQLADYMVGYAVEKKSKRYYQKQADEIQKILDRRAEIRAFDQYVGEDFDQGSVYQEDGSEKRTKGIFGTQKLSVYDYINNKAYREQLGDEADTDSDDKTAAMMMYPDEIKMYSYLYNTQGEKVAQDYFKKLRPELLERNSEILNYYQYHLAKDSAAGNAVTFAGNRVLNLANSMMFVPQAIGALTGNEDFTDTNSSMYASNRAYENTVSGGAAGLGELTGKLFNNQDIGTFIYNVLNSSADSAVSAGIGGGIAGTIGEAFGFANDTERVAKLAGHLTNVIMSSAAASSALKQELDKGRDPWQAVAIGAARGAVEALTEEISPEGAYGNFFKANKGVGVKGFVRGFVSSFLSEGSEEINSDLLNEVINEVVGDDEAWSNLYEQYQADPESTDGQAFVNTLKDVVGQVAYSFLSGAVSGGLGYASNVATGALGVRAEDMMDRRRQNTTAANAVLQSGAINDLIDMGLSMPEGSEAYQAAMAEAAARGLQVEDGRVVRAVQEQQTQDEQAQAEEAQAEQAQQEEKKPRTRITRTDRIVNQEANTAEDAQNPVREETAEEVAEERQTEAVEE